MAEYLKEKLNPEGKVFCWKHRDNYWECLDKYAPDFDRIKGQVHGTEDEPAECIELRKLFVNNCPVQWISQFDRRRTYDQLKKRFHKERERKEKEAQEEKNQ